MSRIYITEYDGDPEEFEQDDPESAGSVDATSIYTDGEELAAAAHVLECMTNGIHFDVRREVF